MTVLHCGVGGGRRGGGYGDREGLGGGRGEEGGEEDEDEEGRKCGRSLLGIHSSPYPWHGGQATSIFQTRTPTKQESRK